MLCNHFAICPKSGTEGISRHHSMLFQKKLALGAFAYNVRTRFVGQDSSSKNYRQKNQQQLPALTFHDYSFHANRVAGGCYQPRAPTDIPHNAHQNQFVSRVYYPYHPRAGEDIYVVGIRSHRGDHCYVMALHDGRHELIPAWMTHPDFEHVSLVSIPSLPIRALHNLRGLINSAIPSFSGKVTSRKRRDNAETKRASTSDHLGAYTISNLNSSWNRRRIGQSVGRSYISLLARTQGKQLPWTEGGWAW